MNKIFDDIRLIAKNAIGDLQERIEESLEKLFEQVQQPTPKPEEKVQAKRQSKVSEPEPVKKQKIEEAKEPKEKKDPKEQKDQKEQKETKEHKEYKEQIEHKEHKEQKDVKDQKNKKDAIEKIPEKRQRSEESLEEAQSDLESLGLDSNDSETSSEKSEQKELGIADLPKNNENLTIVLKTLENPGDKFESLLDYLISIIQGSDASLQDRIKRLDLDKKFGKLNVPSELKPKLKKIFSFVKISTTQQPDHLKDLEILKKKLEGAIGRKIDTEIQGMFRRFEDKLKEKLGQKEAEMLEEVIKTLQNLMKTYKNSEIRKSASNMIDKIRSKIEGISKKR